MIISRLIERYNGDSYDPREFHDEIAEYESGTSAPISRAMDAGTEEDIRRALCGYVDRHHYNPLIKDFINAASWLDGDNGKDWGKVVPISEIGGLVEVPGDIHGLPKGSRITEQVKTLVYKLRELTGKDSKFGSDSWYTGGDDEKKVFSVKVYVGSASFMCIIYVVSRVYHNEYRLANVVTEVTGGCINSYVKHVHDPINALEGMTDVYSKFIEYAEANAKLSEKFSTLFDTVPGRVRQSAV